MSHEELILKKVIMAAHLINSPAIPQTCRHCRVSVLGALVDGLPTRVDPTLINSLTEAVALIGGRWTYRISPYSYLVRRTGTAREGDHVVADHVCGAPLPGVGIRSMKTSPYTDENPPF